MTRLVQGPDGRTWRVHSRLEWADPVREEEFEHDVSGGRIGSIMMVVILFALLFAFVLLTPDAIVFPSWLALALVLLVLFLPVRWLVRRPYTLVAETPGGPPESGLPAERWVGTVRGFFTARSETSRACRHVRKYATPDHDGDGPLQPVTTVRH